MQIEGYADASAAATDSRPRCKGARDEASGAYTTHQHSAVRGDACRPGNRQLGGAVALNQQVLVVSTGVPCVAASCAQCRLSDVECSGGTSTPHAAVDTTVHTGCLQYTPAQQSTHAKPGARQSRTPHSTAGGRCGTAKRGAAGSRVIARARPSKTRLQINFETFVHVRILRSITKSVYLKCENVSLAPTKHSVT